MEKKTKINCIKIDSLIAKSDGEKLETHSLKVALTAKFIGERMLKVNDDKSKLLKIIYRCGLLHDIGKCTINFQKKLKNDKYSEENIEEKEKYRHNEIGWAFLSRHLDLGSNELNLILDSIYWHHGISNMMESYFNTDIYQKLKESEITLMTELANKLLGEDLLIEKEYKPKKAPIFYSDDENADEDNMLKVLIRTCVISADRIVSSLPPNITDDDLISFIDAELNLTNTIPSEIINAINIENHVYAGNERFEVQKNVGLNADKTVSVNAPAGYGKTLMGLLVSICQGKNVIWVCPRNVVAEGVYKSILEDLKGFGDTKLSVELYLGGEAVDFNENFTKEFSSNIIVTNIDNYLRPSVDNNHANRLYQILTSYVVFDEYHEFMTETGLFACFINLMRIRNRLTSELTRSQQS